MTLRSKLVAALAIALMTCLPAWATAQVASAGTVEVVVEDADGGRLPGVTVTATAPDTVTKRTAVTDGQGVAVLDALAPSTQYTIVAELSGFQNQTVNQVLVRSGQTASLRVAMSIAGLTEAVTVTAATPIVDVKSAQVGQDITLQLTESLPTGRSYQSYLQLVPGVLPDDQTQSGNPAARGGMNYSDIGGNFGVSSDNVYYFDAINVTDPVTGTFGANLNTEIIQEQRVITGGIPAEYVGSPGLISNVVTKSGSNAFHGSANYFFQNANLVAENKNGADQEYATKDNGYTIGGPIYRDKAWFFGSYRYLNREDDVVSLDTDQFLRTVDNTQHQGFAKGTWAATQDDLFAFTYLGDPTEITGRRDRDITNARDRGQEQGGHRYAGNYSRVWGSTLLEVVGSKHNGEVSQFSAIRQPQVTAMFRGPDPRTLEQEQLGGFGQDLINQRDNIGFSATAQHSVGIHTIKAGLGWDKHDNFRDTTYVGGEILMGPAGQYGAVTATDIATTSWSNLGFDVTNSSDFGGLIGTINGRPDRARFYAALDLNGDGTITSAEAGQAMLFNSIGTDGTLNYDRTFQAATGPQETSSKGITFFIQDQVTFNRLTLNAGIRTERWEHFATTGENIFTFDWAIAPRLSAVYDVRGDGRQRLSAYWGRYYDPIRNNMTNFAGTLTGSILEEQVFVLGEFVNYRTRGGPVQQDAFFSPTTKTPYTDDFNLGYGVDLGNNMSFDALYFNRRTRDILEDYDLFLYSDPEGYQNLDGSPGDPGAPNSLFLPLSYFGYSENPGSNFVIGTLEGGKRNFQGLEFVFRKRFANNWQLLSSYNWNDGKGNTNSDSNADFQGDVLFLDPRAPNQYGTQPGLIRHLLKGAGSYTFNMGLQLGATMSWNSGTLGSDTFLTSSRNLPIRVSTADAYEFGGTVNRWIAPDTVGTFENPAWGQLDLRAQYLKAIGGVNAEFFVDLFNVFNNQSSIREQDLVAGAGGNAFGDEILWVLPRRAFLGARVRF
jgi:hypothetical protein